jgi:hypothetical protein
MTLTNPYRNDGGVFIIATIIISLETAKQKILLYGGLIGLFIIGFFSLPIFIGVFKLLNFIFKLTISEKALEVTKENYAKRKQFYDQTRETLSKIESENKNTSFFLIRWLENEVSKYRSHLIQIEEILKKQLFLSFSDAMTEEKMEEGKKVFQDFEDDWEEDDIYDELYYEEARN